MESYAGIKHIHMMFAVLTVVSFLIRSYWMMSDSTMLTKKLVKILPHIIDSALLLSAISLVVLSGLYPFKVDFVTIKLVLLVVYIVLGTIALKRGKTKKIRIIAMVLSLLTVLSIFAVAMIKPTF